MRKAVWLFLVPVACGETEPPPPFEFGEEQAVAIFEALHGLESRADRIYREDSVLVSCPKEGDAKIAGEFEVIDEDTVVKTTLDYTATPRNCGIEVAGDEFSITGVPNHRNLLEMTLHRRPDPAFEVTGSIKGTFAWVMGDHEGGCGMGLNVVGYSADLDGGLELEYRGSLCGFDVVSYRNRSVLP